MLNKIKQLVNNKRGNAGIAFIIMILLMLGIEMVFGVMETSLSVMTVNEVKDIIENVSPIAVREGINENEHMNEKIIEFFSVDDAKEYFVEQVSTEIERMNFRKRILTSASEIKDKLDANTRIVTNSGAWVNTWNTLDSDGNKKSMDYVIISTILPLELENKYTAIDAQKIEKQFTVSDESGRGTTVTVHVDVTENGLGVFIKFEMKVVLA